MSKYDEVFHNPVSGETFVHREGPDGKRDFKFGPTGTHLEGHAVLLPNGNPSYIREDDGRVVADDRFDFRKGFEAFKPIGTETASERFGIKPTGGFGR